MAGLLGFAESSKRDDSHTLAHLGAMHANAWAMRTLLQAAGEEIDRAPAGTAAQKRALTLRHAIDHLASDTLQHFARAYGPFPLAMHAEASRRYQEAEIFLRQCHAERDLEALGRLLRAHQRTFVCPTAEFRQCLMNAFAFQREGAVAL